VTGYVRASSVFSGAKDARFSLKIIAPPRFHRLLGQLLPLQQYLG
jgi:hypothetical protein